MNKPKKTPLQAIITDIVSTSKYTPADIAKYAKVKIATIRRIKSGFTKKPRRKTSEKLFSLYFSIQHLLKTDANNITTSTNKEMPRTHHPKILLVEDTPLVQQAHTMLLQKLGYTADLAKNGNEALEYTEKHKYDLILMDIGLPDISGIEATKQIRANTIFKSHKSFIVALTAYVVDDIKNDCLAAGIDIVESKPISLNKLQQFCSDTTSKTA